MNSGHADRVNLEQPGQVSRTNYDKIKNVEFKTIIHCQVETRKVILFPKSVSFALQVELRPDSVQRDRPSLTGPSGS